MNLFEEYMQYIEAVGDDRKIKNLKRQIAKLQASGDDEWHRSEIRSKREEIRRIKESNMSPEQLAKDKEKRANAAIKASGKRQDAAKKRNKSAAEFYNTLSDEDKAIHAIDTLKRGLQSAKKTWGHTNKDSINGTKKGISYQNLMIEIKNAFNLSGNMSSFKSKLDTKQKRAISQYSKPASIIPKKLKDLCDKHKIKYYYVI